MPYLVPEQYEDDFRAQILAGAVARLALAVYEDLGETLEDLTGRSFIQRVFTPDGTIVASVAGLITTDGDAVPIVEFTLSGTVTQALLATGQEARDLRHTVVEITDTDNEIDLIEPTKGAPFKVRRTASRS